MHVEFYFYVYWRWQGQSTDPTYPMALELQFTKRYRTKVPRLDYTNDALLTMHLLIRIINRQVIVSGSAIKGGM